MPEASQQGSGQRKLATAGRVARRASASSIRRIGRGDVRLEIAHPDRGAMAAAWRSRTTRSRVSCRIRNCCVFGA
jgi:hypothetical protein